VRFVVEKLTLGQVSLRVLSPCLVSIIRPILHTSLFIMETIILSYRRLSYITHFKKESVFVAASDFCITFGLVN
jgi:hypothetical protein